MEDVKYADDKDEILNQPISWEEKTKKEEKRKIATELLREGLSSDVIARVTDLEQEEVRALNNQ
ncbi:hypothetical protein CFK37_08910 [Virgibacillus phasianinus]|uniref:Transposase n=2 Tax=Virgibacillus phasianinus TaxID=2017483 RepID=A0A220U374_9BACI|nr:hypothetical protein CFK37_08910 [Virgibacillus phasianinus]